MLILEAAKGLDKTQSAEDKTHESYLRLQGALGEGKHVCAEALLDHLIV